MIEVHRQLVTLPSEHKINYVAADVDAIMSATNFGEEARPNLASLSEEGDPKEEQKRGSTMTVSDEKIEAQTDLQDEHAVTPKAQNAPKVNAEDEKEPNRSAGGGQRVPNVIEEPNGPGGAQYQAQE